MRLLARLVVVAFTPLCSAASPAADGWITHPDFVRGGTSAPVVLEFQRELALRHLPPMLPVHVTADSRYVLYVNGKRVGSGPSTGTVNRWRYAWYDLRPHLIPGKNTVTAVVWNFGDFAPASQQSVATGLRLEGTGLSTESAGWRVRVVRGHTAANPKEHISWDYYVASTPEVIDASKAPEEWRDAVAAPAAAMRTLVEDRLPAQLYLPADPGKVVRSSLPGGERFPAAPLEVPANTTARLLIRLDVMRSAYPELEVSGGRGAQIRLEYGEALYDAENRKADRNLVGDRRLRGFHDSFIADGGQRVFAPLWWRTFRFAGIEVVTQDQPLTLRAFRLHETGYPFERRGWFDSSDPELNRIWDIGWRTLSVDAHETFMDSSYWEQLQYTGDTRIEMLLSYAVSGDARLARQAIEAFADSDVEGGLMQGAYPSRLQNVIATFSLAWVGMLADWHRQQPDTGLLLRQMPRMRRVLAWFEPYVNVDGLLGKSPHWNFIDWSGQRWDDRDTFPSWGSKNGSCLMTAMWVGALRQGENLEKALGEARRAGEYAAKAFRARDAIRRHCWVAERGLFADDSDRKVFSQHMNVFAVLYDIAEPAERRAILERITVPGKGIDAPPGMYAASYYFAWYLVRAFEHAGLPEKYFELLQSWRDLLPLNYTTWPETREQPRSDTHAWSAHPTADLLAIVAGIQPGAPGYSRLRVAPTLGSLTALDAAAATPKGLVTVHYRIADGALNAEVERPGGLPGEFVWRGERHPLTEKVTRLKLPAR